MKTYKIILASVIILIVALSYVFLLRDKPEEAVFCTQEALLCPGGDYVSRSGPMCEFSTCAQVDSVVGILEQTSEGFRLLLDSPSEGGEVTYVLPIEIRVSNALQDFVNKRVRAYGLFLEGNLYKVETLEALPGDQGDRTLGEVSVGETTYINGVNVTFNKLVQESRCPVDANCIEAGAVVANLTLKSDTDGETRNFASDEAPAPFDIFKISIARIEPPLYSGKSIDPQDYKLTIRVER